MISYVTAADSIPHCSDKNVFLFSTTSVAGARARPSQYLYNMITFKSREWDKVRFFHLPVPTGCSGIKTVCT